MTEYRVGQTYRATVKGVKDVLVVRSISNSSVSVNGDSWWTPRDVLDGSRHHVDREVTDVRPLVTFDPGPYTRVDALAILRNARDATNASEEGFLGLIEAAVREQIPLPKPPRIKEPRNRGAVVEDMRDGTIYTRYTLSHQIPWISQTGVLCGWDSITDPELRAGGYNR